MACSTSAISQSNLEISLLWMLMLTGKDETTCWVLLFLYSSKLHFSSLEVCLLVECYTWSIALCGTETWTFRKVDQKYMQGF
jgi:hypothetical protein